MKNGYVNAVIKSRKKDYKLFETDMNERVRKTVDKKNSYQEWKNLLYTTFAPFEEVTNKKIF